MCFQVIYLTTLKAPKVKSRRQNLHMPNFKKHLVQDVLHCKFKDLSANSVDLNEAAYYESLPQDSNCFLRTQTASEGPKLLPRDPNCFRRTQTTSSGHCFSRTQTASSGPNCFLRTQTASSGLKLFPKDPNCFLRTQIASS